MQDLVYFVSRVCIAFIRGDYSRGIVHIPHPRSLSFQDSPGVQQKPMLRCVCVLQKDDECGTEEAKGASATAGQRTASCVVIDRCSSKEKERSTVSSEGACTSPRFISSASASQKLKSLALFILYIPLLVIINPTTIDFSP